MFPEFFLNGKIEVCLNSTSISFLLRKDRSIMVKDFRPISLVSGVYKIITKVLVARLSEVLSDTNFKN